jgi:hypothetical protein
MFCGVFLLTSQQIGEDGTSSELELGLLRDPFGEIPVPKIKSRPSLRAGGLLKGGLLRDPIWEIPTPKIKSRPSLCAGGLLN